MKPYDLSVVMPVYNEAEAIGPVLEKWRAMLDALAIRYRIRVYNDGSKDATGSILSTIAEQSDGRILAITKPNSGHGPTILQGYREAVEDSDWVFQIDSDDEMGPESFPALWNAREDYDFLLGQRDGRRQPLPRKVISFVSRLCVRLFYKQGVWDVNAPYRLMRASAFAEFYTAIPADTFAPNVILSGLAAREGLRLLEVPVPQHDRTTGEVSIKKWKLLKAAARSFAQTIAFAGIPPKLGYGGAIAVTVACLLLNFITLTRSPTAWMDEISYADPGIRLAAGEGFTSAVWYSQNETTFFAGNVPLHPAFIAGWVSLFGESMFSVRSGNLFLMVVASWLVFALVCKVSRTYWTGWLAMVLTWSLPGILFSYRSGRPDVEVLIVGLLFLLASLARTRILRFVGVAAAAFVMPFAGLQGMPWLVLLLPFAVCLQGESISRAMIGRWTAVAIFAAIGGVLGFAALLGLYELHGLREVFWTATFGSHSLATSASYGDRLLGALLSPPWSYVITSLLGCGVVLSVVQSPRWWLMGALAVCAVTPSVLQFLGKFPIYYHFMAEIPLVIVVCLALVGLQKGKKMVAGGVICVALGLALTGLPARTAVGILGWSSRDYAPVQAFIRNHITSDDVVAASWQTYYAVRAITPRCYIPSELSYPRPPSIYEADATHRIVDADKATKFAQNHPEWVPVATYSASGNAAGSAAGYAFIIFQRVAQ